MQKCPSKPLDGVGLAICGIVCMLAATVLPLYVTHIGLRFHEKPSRLFIMDVSYLVIGSLSAWYQPPKRLARKLLPVRTE